MEPMQKAKQLYESFGSKKLAILHVNEVIRLFRTTKSTKESLYQYRHYLEILYELKKI